MIIELKGHIGEDGKIIVEAQSTLAAGDLDIVIAYTNEAEIEDEAQWAAQFAATPVSAFEALIQESLTEVHNENA